MSIITKRVCDMCGAAQGETNHWFTGNSSEDSVLIRTYRYRNPTEVDLCGEQCVLAFVQRWLRRQKEAPDDHNRS